MAALAELEAALRPVGELLAADGFRLSVSATAAGTAVLAVAAGPEACPECLVPKEVFTAIAMKHLRDRGLHVGVEIVYPDEDAAP